VVVGLWIEADALVLGDDEAADACGQLELLGILRHLDQAHDTGTVVADLARRGVAGGHGRIEEQCIPAGQRRPIRFPICFSARVQIIHSWGGLGAAGKREDRKAQDDSQGSHARRDSNRRAQAPIQYYPTVMIPTGPSAASNWRAGLPLQSILCGYPTLADA